MKQVPCEVFSRVVGYFRPIHFWNDGKKEEFGDRVAFNEETSLNSKIINGCKCVEEAPVTKVIA